MKKAKEFRKSAFEALKGRWGLAVIAGVIASILGGVSTPSFSFGFSGSSESEESSSVWFGDVESDMLGVILIVAGIAFMIGLVIYAVYFVIGSTVMLGYSKFNLLLIDGQEAKIGNIFEYFKVWKRAALTQLLRVIYTVLWTFLLIIPGIIAWYRYAMTPYILAEFPEISPKEAIETSKKLMDGNKARLVCLEISFTGWAILCVFTLGIGFLWLIPYMNASKADFYREISGTRPKSDIPLDDFFVSPDAE